MKRNTHRTICAAACLALGLVLPQVFHLLGAGTVFLPMHIPVLLCGFLCGWQYGLAVGAITPLLSALVTGMPPIFPTAVAMMFELATYGIVCGALYPRRNIYVALVSGMLAGRVVSGVANAVFMGVAGKAYTFSAFIAGAFVTALPGIIIQVIALPILVKLLERTKLVPARQPA